MKPAPPRLCSASPACFRFTSGLRVATSTFLTRWAGLSPAGGRPAHYEVSSGLPGLPAPTPGGPLTCDNQNCPQTLPNVPWGQNCPPVEINPDPGFLFVKPTPGDMVSRPPCLRPRRGPVRDATPGRCRRLGPYLVCGRQPRPGLVGSSVVVLGFRHLHVVTEPYQNFPVSELVDCGSLIQLK